MLHTDAKYSSGDVIQIFFDQPTNMAPFGVYDVTNSFASFGKSLSKSDVDNLFAFSQSLVQNSSTSSTYTGWWISDTVFQINIISEGYPQPSIKVSNLYKINKLMKKEFHFQLLVGKCYLLALTFKKIRNIFTTRN